MAHAGAVHVTKKASAKQIRTSLGITPTATADARRIVLKSAGKTEGVFVYVGKRSGSGKLILRQVSQKKK